MADNHFTLSCLVDGESTSQAFSVEIDRTKTVDHLKKAIKAEIPDTFNGVDAKDLTLWRVSIPFTDDDEELPIVLNILEEKKKLSSGTRLSKVFSEDLLEEGNPHHRPATPAKPHLGARFLAVRA